MGRIRSWPSGTALARLACTTRVRPTVLPGWPRAAAHDPVAWRPSGGRAPVQRARAAASLCWLHGGTGPRCSGGYACLNGARAWQHNGGRSGGCSEGKGRPHRACATAKAKRTPSSASSASSELHGPPRACFGWLHDRGRQRSMVTFGRRWMAWDGGRHNECRI
jgi:hypothetical protein